MDPEIIDQLEEEDSSRDSPLYNALSWWEKKRIWYNIFELASGIFPIALYADGFSLGELVGVVAYGIILNLFYSFGFFLETIDIYYFKQRFYFKNLRYPLLIIGTFLSSLLTYAMVESYFA